jgi:hypothetical protein
VLSAQQALPEPAAIATALAGDAAHDVAWAAHHARERADKLLVKPLLHALGRWRLSNDENAGFVCVHLLDALLELDARVPAGDLVPLVDDERCGTWAFVLLAREPRLDEAELFTSSDGTGRRSIADCRDSRICARSRSAICSPRKARPDSPNSCSAASTWSAPRRTPLDDADAFAAMVVRAREQQQVFVDVLRRELIARRALTEKEAESLRHRVVALIIDERGNREVPLPTIPPAR